MNKTTIKPSPDWIRLLLKQDSSLSLRFTIKYFDDEIKIFENKCMNESICTCKRSSDASQCAYTAEQIKAKLQEYYQQRADYIAKQSIEDFLHDQGIYI